MTPDDAFLQAILEQPDDDTPRLMYADWLAERGDDRGEFIRAQIELTRAPSDNRRVHWEAVERRLLSLHRETWLAPIRSLAYRWEFRRGFPEEVAIEAAGFLTHANLFFEHTPLRLARLLRASGLISELVHSPFLGRLSALHLTDNGIGEHGVAELADSRHMRNLTALRLGNNHIGDRGAVALAESPHLGRLTTLNLNRNHIGNAGAIALAGSAAFAGLTALHLGDNQIGPAGVEALLESPYLGGLQTLELVNSAVQTAGGNRVSPPLRLKLKERFPAAVLSC